MERETGFAICRTDKGKITKGKTVTGDSHSVSIPLLCREGKPIGVHHNHPGGSLHLSEQDKKTAKTKKLKIVCVKARGKTKCYKFRHKG